MVASCIVLPAWDAICVELPRGWRVPADRGIPAGRSLDYLAAARITLVTALG